MHVFNFRINCCLSSSVQNFAGFFILGSLSNIRLFPTWMVLIFCFLKKKDNTVFDMDFYCYRICSLFFLPCINQFFFLQISGNQQKFQDTKTRKERQGKNITDLFFFISVWIFFYLCSLFMKLKAKYCTSKYFFKRILTLRIAEIFRPIFRHSLFFFHESSSSFCVIAFLTGNKISDCKFSIN